MRCEFSGTGSEEGKVRGTPNFTNSALEGHLLILGINATKLWWYR